MIHHHHPTPSLQLASHHNMEIDRRMNGISRPRPSLASAISTTTDDNHNDGRRRKVSSARAAIISNNNNNSNNKTSSEPSILSESKIERLDLLKELQAEIQNLKYENHELKFFLYVALKQDEGEHKRAKEAFTCEMANMARDYLEETNNARNMQMELEAMGCMLDEARWVQNHYEIRVRDQELKIEELEKQLLGMKSRDFTLLQLQVPSDRPARTSRRVVAAGDESSGRTRPSGRRQRSLSTNGQPRANVSRLNKQFLPDDYKDTVATLPPIIDARRHHQTTKTQLWAQTHRVT